MAELSLLIIGFVIGVVVGQQSGGPGDKGAAGASCATWARRPHPLHPKRAVA